MGNIMWPWTAKQPRPEPPVPRGTVGLGGVGRVALKRPRRNDARHALPDPTLYPASYLQECRYRMNQALADYAAIEGRIRELYDYWKDRMANEYDGWIELKNTDTEAKRLFSLRENSRQRARTYAAVIQTELVMREFESRDN